MLRHISQLVSRGPGGAKDESSFPSQGPNQSTFQFFIFPTSVENLDKRFAQRHVHLRWMGSDLAHGGKFDECGRRVTWEAPVVISSQVPLEKLRHAEGFAPRLEKLEVVSDGVHAKGMLQRWPSCTLDLSSLCLPGKDFEISMALPLNQNHSSSSSHHCMQGPSINLRIVSYPQEFKAKGSFKYGSITLDPVMSFVPEDTLSRGSGKNPKDMLVSALKKVPASIPSPKGIIEESCKLYETLMGPGRTEGKKDPEIEKVERGDKSFLWQMLTHARKGVGKSSSESNLTVLVSGVRMYPTISGKSASQCDLAGQATSSWPQDASKAPASPKIQKSSASHSSTLSTPENDLRLQRVMDWDKHAPFAADKLSPATNQPGHTLPLSRFNKDLDQAEPSMPRPPRLNDNATSDWPVSPPLEVLSSLAVEVDQSDLHKEEEGLSASAGPRMAIKQQPQARMRVRLQQSSDSQLPRGLPEYEVSSVSGAFKPSQSAGSKRASQGSAM